MPRDASETRSLLLRAAERRFAREGYTTTRLRDVVRDAGQANDAAIHYHFGGREGLLTVLITEHIQVMEGWRELPPPEAGMTALMHAIVEPGARLLHDQRGRDFLRIGLQVTIGDPRSRAGRLPSYLHDTKMGQQWLALVARIPGPRATERAGTLMFFSLTSLANRARHLDEDDEPPALGHQEFLTDLVAMLSAAALANPDAV